MSRLAIHGGSPVRTRPFVEWPLLDQAQEDALVQVYRSGKWWRFAFGQGVELTEPSDGEQGQVALFQKEFAHLHGCRYGIAAANGTGTMEMGIRAMNLEIGDEIIVPAYNYVAGATCVLQNNLVPVFVDVQPDSYQIDPARIDEAITPRTRAILVVHFSGHPVDLDAVAAVAEKHALAVIEDAAHAHGSHWRQRPIGSFGLFSSFSFQASKNMTAGEGGILCSNDHSLTTECESLLWAGRRIGRPWYEFHRLGWNYRMTEFQAALLRVQLRSLAQHVAARTANARYLSSLLANIPGIRPLAVDPRTTAHSYHLYILRYDEDALGLPRHRFLEALVAEGVPAAAGYAFPLYKNPMFLNKQFANGSFPLNTAYNADVDYASFESRCPVAERACRCEAVWLPHSVFLGTEKDMEDIAEAIAKVLRHLSPAAKRHGCPTHVRPS